MAQLPLAILAALVFVTAFLAALTAVDVVRRYSLRRRVLDVPNQRSSHTVPTPRGGGLGIVISFVLMTVFAWVAGSITPTLAVALLGGGGLVAWVGWIDDHRGLSARTRFIAYSLAAVIAVVTLDSNWPPAEGWSRLFWNAVAVLALVWLTNLFNFMDGIDGLAGMEGAFVAGGGGMIMALAGDSGLALLCFALAAANLGFLVWNWAPARIFMGDVGSAFMGFVLGVLALAGQTYASVSPWLWALLLAVFGIDATLTLLWRIARGEKWYNAHRSHAYQRLVVMGMSHARVSLAALLINLLVIFPLVLLSFRLPQLLPVALGAIAAAGWWLWRSIQRRYLREQGQTPSQIGSG